MRPIAIFSSFYNNIVIKSIHSVSFHVRPYADRTKNNTKKDDVVQGLLYKELNGKTYKESSPPMEIKRIGVTGNQVYGIELDDVEKDDKFTDIPKFVVECIRIIELEENMQTNGIYRASGKKDSIDKLRKKVDTRRGHLISMNIKFRID